MTHIPVLKKEVIEYLDPKPGENFIDATINGGGHALMILEKIMPSGKLLGIDLDSDLIKNLELRIKNYEFRKNLILINDNYKNLDEIVLKNNFQPDGILFDLGMSSEQLEKSGRGFSFLKDEFLDMRFSTNQELTAYEIINSWSKEEIAKILKEYGEEGFHNQIATAIYNRRRKEKINTTRELTEIILKTVPVWYQNKKIHPATKTFQSLRITVNDELNNIKSVLKKSMEVLKPEGRLAIISFHSLEDGLIKNFFKEGNKNKILKILTKKPITPTRKELLENPRSRSAKLRAVIKIK